MHWAVKRNDVKMARMLLQNFADVNAMGLARRSPLFYALRNNSFDLVKLLLVERAKPWKKMISSFENETIPKMSPEIQLMFKKARQLHILCGMHQLCQRRKVWLENISMIMISKRSS